MHTQWFYVCRSTPQVRLQELRGVRLHGDQEEKREEGHGNGKRIHVHMHVVFSYALATLFRIASALTLKP